MEPLEEAVPGAARRTRDRRRGLRRPPRRGQHPPRGPGPRRGARARHRRAARRGAHPRRGLPGRRQDRAGARAVALDRLPVRARAVHGRPAARRHRRHQRLQPARGALRVPPRPDLRQRRARRRGQPRLAEDAVRPARVHAGAPGHRRRDVARAGAPVPGLRDAEPGRVRGHLPAARGAGRPLHGPALARLPDRRGGGRHARRPRVARPRARPRAGRRPRRDRRRRRDRAPRARLARAARLHRRAAAPHARGRPRRARRLAARRPDAAARRQGARARPRAATTRCPTTSRRSPTPCSRTASCSRPRRRASSAPRSSRDAIAATSRRSRSARCARRSAARRSGSCCCSSRARSTPSRCTSPARRCCCSARARWRGSALGGVGREARRASSACARWSRSSRCRSGSAPTPARLPLPPGWIDEPLLPEPLRLPAGRRRRACASRSRSAAAAAAGSPPPALVLRDPFGLAQRVDHAAPPPTRCSCCRGSSRCALTAGGGDATPAHARASLLAAAETEIDGLRPWREGSPASRIHWQSFARGAGADGAQADLRGRLAPAGRDRPARAGLTARRSTPPCAPPPRSRVHFASAPAARCCCPATAART